MYSEKTEDVKNEGFMRGFLTNNKCALTKKFQSPQRSVFFFQLLYTYEK